VQVAEVSVAFFEWIGWFGGKRFIKRITIGLTVAGIILSTLHQGALGALFNYAPGKVHPLWFSASFQWIHFFCSSIPAGLCMVIVVSTVIKKTMAWRCDANFIDNLDRCTFGLAKGASMALITYLAIKLIGIAHDNEWGYLATGWGAWFLLEMAIGVVLPIILFAYAIRHQIVGLARLGAVATVFGIVLNRLNTAIIAFNWQLYQETPHLFEVIIALTIFAIYVVVYRFILYRLPIIYSWQEQPQEAHVAEVAKPAPIRTTPSPAGVMYRRID
jgi:hypothetical protein